MDIAIHVIVVALIFIAALLIEMIAGNAIAIQLLMTAGAKVTMLNIDQDYNQIKVLFL